MKCMAKSSDSMAAAILADSSTWKLIVIAIICHDCRWRNCVNNFLCAALSDFADAVSKKNIQFAMARVSAMLSNICANENLFGWCALTSHSFRSSEIDNEDNSRKSKTFSSVSFVEFKSLCNAKTRRKVSCSSNWIGCYSHQSHRRHRRRLRCRRRKDSTYPELRLHCSSNRRKWFFSCFQFNFLSVCRQIEANHYAWGDHRNWVHVINDLWVCE